MEQFKLGRSYVAEDRISSWVDVINISEANVFGTDLSSSGRPAKAQWSSAPGSYSKRAGLITNSAPETCRAADQSMRSFARLDNHMFFSQYAVLIAKDEG